MNIIKGEQYSSMKHNQDKLFDQKQLESERRLNELIIQTAPVIIIVLNKQGCIEMANPYFEHITGYSLSEIKGKDWFTTFLPEKVQDKIRQFFFKAINNIHTSGNINPIITKSGKEIAISWYDVTLKDSGENVTGLLCIGLDMSKLDAAKHEPHISRKDKSNCLAKMSHEVRTPMNAILGFSEILSDMISDPQQKEYLNTIKSSVLVLLKLFDNPGNVEESKLLTQMDHMDSDNIVFNKNTKILIVDDIATNLYVLSQYLKDFDFEILQADNGDSAIDMARSYQPDLIFMDYHMPVLDGYKAARFIKMDPALSKIPIVLITASAFQDTLDQIEKEGFSYIKKPFHKSTITEKLLQFIPYKRKKHSNTNDTKNLPPIKLSSDMIDNAPEFKMILKNEFYPQWNKYLEKLYMDDINKWAMRLKEYALRFSCKPIQEYSDRLVDHIDSFDIVRLQKDWKLFLHLFDNNNK